MSQELKEENLLKEILEKVEEQKEISKEEFLLEWVKILTHKQIKLESEVEDMVSRLSVLETLALLSLKNVPGTINS
jgi:hypothetical protein